MITGTLSTKRGAKAGRRQRASTTGVMLFPTIVVLTSPVATGADHRDAEIQALRDEVSEHRQLVMQLKNGSKPAHSSEEFSLQTNRSSSTRAMTSETIRDEDDSVGELLVQVKARPDDGANAGPSPSKIVASQDLNELLNAPRQPVGRFPDDAVVTAGRFDKSISVPGTRGAFRLGGLVQVSGNYDPDSLGFQQIGTQPTIPLDGSVDDGDSQFAIHVRHSRVNFDYRSPSELGEFRTFVEFDFFGDGDEFTNDYDLRLRHAMAELGPWKVGQFWSGFVDVFSFPETVDPGGPLGAPVLRNPGIYYAKGDYGKSSWGVGIENPAGDLGGNVDQIASESVPNVVGFRRFDAPWGYARIAAMGLRLESDTDAEFAGGVHLSGRVFTPFSGSEENNLSFALQLGDGFVHYYSSFVGELDGVIAGDGSIEATGILGGFIGYQHFWRDKLRSTITASILDFDSPTGADLLSYAGGERYSANLFFTPTAGVTLGLEAIYYSIEGGNGQKGDGTRIEFVGRFDF